MNAGSRSSRMRSRIFGPIAPCAASTSAGTAARRGARSSAPRRCSPAPALMTNGRGSPPADVRSPLPGYRRSATSPAKTHELGQDAEATVRCEGERSGLISRKWQRTHRDEARGRSRGRSSASKTRRDASSTASPSASSAPGSACSRPSTGAMPSAPPCTPSSAWSPMPLSCSSARSGGG